MTTPCEHKDDFKLMHHKIDKLTDAFNTFQLNTAVEIAVIKTEAKHNSKKEGGKSGGKWGAIASIVIAIITALTAKASL